MILTIQMSSIIIVMLESSGLQIKELRRYALFGELRYRAFELGPGASNVLRERLIESHESLNSLQAL